MERIKNNGPENPEEKPKQLSGKEKLEVILGLFGTEAARDGFINTCKEYVKARTKAVHESYAQDSYVRHRAIFSSPKQAVLHNKIMDTLTRLASQSEKLTPLQSEVLREMYNRDITVEVIKEYVAYLEGLPKPKEEDEENGGKPSGMSDTAYYHSLGKEH